MSERKLIGRDCKRAVYCLNKETGRSDMVFVKEHRYYDNGDVEPATAMYENFKRDFYVTKEGYRDHKEKKEWEDIHKLQKYTTPQWDMARMAAVALKDYGNAKNPRMLTRSPYLYGFDLPVDGVIKGLYKKKWPEHCTPKATVGAMDIEVDVVRGTDEILMVSNTFGDTTHLVVNEAFFEGRGLIDPVEKVVEKTKLLLADILELLQIKNVVVTTEPSAALCVKSSLNLFHKWQPDLVSIWNSHYDVPRMQQALEAEGFDPADAFSDPSVPSHYRFFRYKEGAKIQVTAKGQEKKLADYDRWHKVTFPASFFIVDSMAVYKTIRTAKGNEPNYTLEGVTQRNLGYGKLNFAEVDKLEGLLWHKEMQRNYPIEYCVYAIMDTLVLLALDKKTRDLSQTFVSLCDNSRFEDFKQNPLKIVDDMHFFCLEHNKVIASRPPIVETDLDKYVVSTEDWIVTLSAQNMCHEGACVFKGIDDGNKSLSYGNERYSLHSFNGVVSSVFLNNADIDVTATYPTAQKNLNISKETTKYELYRIESMDELTRRRFGVNFVCGEVNALLTCTQGLLLPSPDELLQVFLEKKNACV